MKIKQLMLKNFAKVSDITVNINPGINFLVGENGAGKTTVGLNGIWFALKGLAQKGENVFHAERFRFVGTNGKSAKAILTIIDAEEEFEATIERKITKTSTELKITASDGRKLGQAWLNEIFNIFTLNIFSLSKMSSKDQALALGIDTAKHDIKIKGLFEDRKEAKKKVAQLKVIADSCEQVEPVKVVDLQALLKQKETMDDENHKKTNNAMEAHNKKLQENIAFNADQGRLAEEVRRLLQEKREAHNKIDQIDKKLSRLSPPKDFLPVDFSPEEVELCNTETITTQINSAEETNEKARKHEEFLKAKKEYVKSNRALGGVINNFEEACEDKTAYVQKANLPFTNMTIDEAGGLLINNKLFCEPYFSKGEIMRMSMILAITQAKIGELKYIFIPDALSLDPKNREKVLQFFSDEGFQVVVEIADNKKVGDNSILLREGRVVESYEINNGEVEL